MDPVVDAEEEALEHAGRTIGVIRELELAPNCGGWAPPHPVDYRHNVHEIRSQRARNLYAEEEKDLRLEARF
jgi:hypothetical protein